MIWNCKKLWGINMKYFYIITVSAFLISCASYEKKNVATPYENYESYIQSLKDKNYKSAVSMLSSKITAEYNSSEDFNDSFPFFSSVDTVVVNEKVSYHKIFDSKSCLTINGYNSVGEPTTLNFEFLFENNAWKFSYVQMMYHETKEEFPLSVTCPPKPDN